MLSKKDSINKVGKLQIKNDTINKLNKSEEQIQDIIDYKSDEQYFDVKSEKVYLVTNANVKYLDMEIQADYVEVDLKTGDVYAVGKQDSTGKIIESSIFKQGGRELEYGSFTYNIKTKRGKSFNVRTEESIGSDKGVIVAGVVKQYNDTISGMRKIAYTTDEYFITKKDTIADYHLEAEVGKFIRGKENKVITGPIVMKIYDITTPLALPFAFLPSGSERTAGILMPSFGERESRGFYLEGLGFYLPIGEYLDFAFLSDIYTKGGYGLRTYTNYKVRYKYSGSLNFNWQNTITGIKGLSSYRKSTNYDLSWRHTQDPKLNPNLIFSANVALRSSKFYQEGSGNYGIANGDYLNNNVNSSISLSKNWPNTPFSASLNVLLNQRMNTRSAEPAEIYMQLPTFSFNVNRINPFAPKNGAKKGMLQSLGLTYSFNLQNQINTNEDDFLKKEMFDKAKMGAQHRLNLNTGTTVFNYFPLSFGANYEEVWTLNTIKRGYDNVSQKVVSEDLKGFDSFRTFGTFASIQTVLYGTKIFGSADDNKKIKAIRHMVSPNLSFNYRPDFGTDSWGYYDSYIDGRGEERAYSRFEGGIYGAPSRVLQESISFGLNNNVELKVRDDEAPNGVKKLKLLETLNITSAYNFAAESFKLSPININGRTSLFQNKLGIGFRAQIDPYKVIVNDENPNGIRIDELGAFRLSNYSVSMNYSFNQDMFSQRDMGIYKTRGAIRYEDFYFDDNNYAQFLTPWTLSLNLNHTVTNSFNGDSRTNTSIGLNGSISPTPHWSFSGRTNFDLQNMDFAGTYFTFSRDLRSFILDFSMNPFGDYKTWNFFIGIKANFLRETIKYEEHNFRSFNSNF